MSKLLSDEELATQLIVMAKRIGASLDDAIDAKIEQNIVSLIRTEKLKLLAEVRERVVGEHKPKTRGLTQNPNNAAYWTKASRAEFDLIEEQLAALTKLEAEL